MKKTYINPTIEVIDIKMNQTLLAGSASLPVGDPGSANNAEAPEFFSDDEFDWFKDVK